MSGSIELRLEHEQPSLDGLITFDGTVVEVFGFNDVHSVRLPVRLIEEAAVSFDSGMLSQPSITFRGRNGSLGYSRAIDPPESLRPEVERFVAAVSEAAAGPGE